MRYIVIIISLGLLGFGVWKIATDRSTGEARRQPVPLVNVDKPMRENIIYLLKFTGDMLPCQQAFLYSKVGGNLEKIFVEIGEQVREGQLLALIDTTELSQQVQLASATLQNANLNYQRNKELSAQNLVPKQDLDNAEAAMKIAQANYDVAKTKLGYARITAPFSGVVTKRFLDPGAVITANNVTLFTVMDIHEMKVNVSILEKDISQVLPGKEATVTVDAFPGEQFTGKIARLSQAVDLSTRTMAVEIDIPNPGQKLKPGMYANVTLVVNEHKDALTVPTSSILNDEAGHFVFVVEDSTAKRKPVSIGIEQNGKTEILSGLNGRENVIVTGQTFVKDDSKVTVQK